MKIVQNRSYVVISWQEVAVLDFSHFLEEDSMTLIYNPDLTQAVVKYVGASSGYEFQYPTVGPFTDQELKQWKEANGWPFIDVVPSDEP